MTEDESPTALQRWQEALLPVMVGLLLFLAGYFVIESRATAQQIIRQLETRPPSGIEAVFAAEARAAGGDRTEVSDRLRLRVLTELEVRAIDHRYRQATLTLLTRTWARYMGFLTGMVLALVGAVFVLGKLRTEATQVSGGVGEGLSASLQSTSPGIVLAGFGTVLMIVAIVRSADLSLFEGGTYLGGGVVPSPAAGATPGAIPSGPPALLDSVARDSARRDSIIRHTLPIPPGR